MKTFQTAALRLFSGAAVFLLPAIAGADCIQWIQRMDVGSPGTRTSPAMAYDSVHGVTVMFGGETTNGSGGRVNTTDTWEYNGTAWRQISITGSSPPGRSYQAMAFDSAHGVVMLCGGQNGGGILKDTWFYASHGDGTGTWTQGPDFDAVGRTGLAMAFDSKRNVMVAMGGMSSLQTTADEPYGTLQPTAFEWNGTSWSAGTPFHGIFRNDLTGIARQAMCFDASEGWVILAGGLVPAYNLPPSSFCSGPLYEIQFNDVEGYGTGLAGWTTVSFTPTTSCSGFSESAMAYDSRRRVSVLFGGSSISSIAPGTMEYPIIDPPQPGLNLNAWDELSLALQPPARSRHAMAYDSRRGVTVLFGGESGAGAGPLGDTWELVPNSPAITVTLTNEQVCQGGSVMFVANVSGGYGSFLYQWQLNGVNLTNNGRISGATNTALTINPVTTNDAGTYVLTTIDSCDNTTFGQSATLTVNYAPIVAGINPTSLALCPGDNGSLGVFYISPLPVTYQWFQNGLPLTGQTNQQLNFVSATTNQSGLYSVTVSDTCGGGGSAAVPVSVGVWVRTPPLGTNVAALCQPKTLSMLARGKGTLTAQWFRNGNQIVPDSRVTESNLLQTTGDTLLTLNFANVEYQDDGVYTATITDACGPVSTAPFFVSVQPNPPWILVATNGPSPRWDAAMAYDSDRRETVLFGGAVFNPTGAPATNDTWEFDGTNWTQRFPSNSPTARSMAEMVYDSKRHRTVLFGGQTFNGVSLVYSPETWEWDGTNWQKITTAQSPTWTLPGYPYAACYDKVRGEMLVFGGVTGGGIVSQLWGYNGINWSLKAPVGNSPVYSTLCSTMDFDMNRGVSVLVGPLGVTYPNVYGYSVWEWDGTVWHERPQSGPVIAALNNANNGFAYDAFRQESVLYGATGGIINGTNVTGLEPSPDYNRFIWRWNGQQWQADPPTPTPGVALHVHHSMVFDSSRNAFVVFGGLQGNNSPNTNYTYELIYQDDPAILKQPTIQISLLGQQVQLSVVAAGAPPIAYQWQKESVNLSNGGRISGATSNTLVINPGTAVDTGHYDVVLSNLCGVLVSKPIQLFVTSTADTVSIGVSGGSLVIVWGDASAMLQSAPGLSGPWSTIIGATSPYTVSPTAPVQYYRLLIP